jgi:hypothetical protein
MKKIILTKEINNYLKEALVQNKKDNLLLDMTSNKIKIKLIPIKLTFLITLSLNLQIT